MSRIRAALALAALAAARVPAEGAPPAPVRKVQSRLSATLGGTLAALGPAFPGRRQFTEFAEEGHLSGEYARQAGPGLDVGLEFRLSGGFGVAASFNLLRRDATSDWQAELPHPLYVARPRHAAGTEDGLSYSERAVHLGLAYQFGRGRWRGGLFAGPSFVHVSAELVERVHYEQAFPYDEVQVTSVATDQLSRDALGFHAGAEAGYHSSPRWAALLRVRYHQASLDLLDAPDAASLDAGGLQAGLSIRLFF
jgi:hypothetical protein